MFSFWSKIAISTVLNQNFVDSEHGKYDNDQSERVS